ncbi:MAG: Gfo/Idh/MocA family oxidoreductase [Planctomycetaceae bacterium]
MCARRPFALALVAGLWIAAGSAVRPEWDGRTIAAAENRLNSAAEATAAFVRVGIIGLDTTHCATFTRHLHDPEAKPDVSGFRVVAAYSKGSPDIESSLQRAPAALQAMRDLNVEIVDSIDELVKKVDVVLLETNDGRPHLEQVLPVLRAKKMVYIDKPMAGSLADVIAIFEASRKYGTPLFSSSCLRFGTEILAVHDGSIGTVRRALATSPFRPKKETFHPDPYFHGIHGIETLYAAMGTGCREVVRTVEDGKVKIVGKWDGDRVGTYREAEGYGGFAEGTKGTAKLGSRIPYREQVVAFVGFFRTGVVPVEPEETIEIFAFMDASVESERRNGAPIELAPLIEKAREDARKRLAELDPEPGAK